MYSLEIRQTGEGHIKKSKPFCQPPASFSRFCFAGPTGWPQRPRSFWEADAQHRCFMAANAPRHDATYGKPTNPTSFPVGTPTCATATCSRAVRKSAVCSAVGSSGDLAAIATLVRPTSGMGRAATAFAPGTPMGERLRRDRDTDSAAPRPSQIMGGGSIPTEDCVSGPMVSCEAIVFRRA